jgi:formate/nitrite transporter FocA (FNT family)
MAHVEEIRAMIAKMQGSGKTFAEFIAELFNERFVEIYVGDSYEEVSTEQISTNYPAVFCGKVIGAYREALILSAAYIGQDKKLQLGNILFVNERSIRGMTEIDGNGIFEEMFLRSRESLAVKAAFGKK